jgi:hypothetical protein
MPDFDTLEDDAEGKVKQAEPELQDKGEADAKTEAEKLKTDL